MPNCPNCGTWNPDDKDVCWRCQHELPKPEPKKKRTTRTFAGLPVWMWVVLIVFFMAMSFGQCVFMGPPPA